MSAGGLRVIKVGGSLFDAEGMPDRLCGWLDELPPARTVLLAGGGGIVEELRRLDRLRPLGEAAAHWAAISLMDVTAWLLATWLQFDVTSDYATLQERLFDADEPIVFAPGRFLREMEPKLMGTRLAKNWEVTSDSIAVRFGTILLAEEVVLLKRCAPKLANGLIQAAPLLLRGNVLEELALAGYVDTFLPRLSGEGPPVSVAWLP
jgi:aspartokinase-like uncharacterized kinase